MKAETVSRIAKCSLFKIMFLLYIFLTSIYIIYYISYCKLNYKAGDCNLSNSHPVQKGDLLYFYNTLPSEEQIVFCEDYVQIARLKYDKENNELKIFMSYPKIMEDGSTKNIPIDFKNIIPEADLINNLLITNYYIVFCEKKTNKIYYLNIITFNNNSITVKYSDSMPVFKDYKNIRIGITASNSRGNSNNDILSLFNINGYNVISVGNTEESQWEVEINYPYDNLPIYFKDSALYTPGSVFLIQDKMQISYSFDLNIKVKDYEDVKSLINDSGQN